MIEEGGHPCYPETIVFTEKLEIVIDKARTLIQDQGCQSVQEQTSLDYNKLFKDPEFTADVQSIFRAGDLPEHKMPLMENKLKKVTWYRP